MIEEVAKIIDKEFGVSKNGSPVGLSKEIFLNEQIVRIAEKHNFPKDIIKLFKENPYKMPAGQKWDNGRGAGEYFINLVKGGDVE